MRPRPFDDVCDVKAEIAVWQMTAAESLSGLYLVAGLRARVVDANLQVRKAALECDGPALGTFSGIEFGLDSPIDLDSEPGRWKVVGTRSHVDIRERVVAAQWLL